MEQTTRLPDDLDSVVFQYIDRPVLLIDGNTTEVIAINPAGMGYFKIKTDLAGVFWPGILDLLNLPSETDLRPFWLIREGMNMQTEDQRIEKFEYIDQENSNEKYLELHLIKPTSDSNQWVVIINDKSDVEQAARSRNDFVSMASHQLRTPLTGIKWNLELFLKRYHKELNDQQLHVLENASKSVERMNELIKALLQLSRIETGALKMKPRKVEIHKLLETVIENQSQLAKRKNIKLITSFHSSLPQIYLDGTLVGFVFENLVSNAIKYSNEGSEVTIFLSKLRGTVMLQVTDTGIGIPPDYQKMIFQKFYRAGNAVSHAPDGTGLGLHLCKIIAHRSGGDIWFESRTGIGTTFWFTIPLEGVKVASDDKQDS
jgi:signal transduction histidine kinase